MTRTKGIPQDVREQVIQIVNEFNARNRGPVRERSHGLGLLSLLRRGAKREDKTKPIPGDYVPRFRGRFLYLDRADYGGDLFEICRLTWMGDINQWKFAIYRHSKNRYAPDEWFFPGAGEVDGTVEGAMRAGLAAYPY